MFKKVLLLSILLQSTMGFTQSSPKSCPSPDNINLLFPPGREYVSFKKASGSITECQQERVVSICNGVTGAFEPVPPSVRYEFCKSPCNDYPAYAPYAIPLRDATSATVTGFVSAAPKYPNLCKSVTRKCANDSLWDATVPVYEKCEQKCAQPDNKNPVAIGHVYKYYAKGSAVTEDECKASYRESRCEASGLILPIPEATRWEKCVVLPPKITAFSSSSQNSFSGESITLSWESSGASSLKIMPGDIDVTGKTSLVVTPAINTNYKLIATNISASTEASMYVTLASKLPGKFVPANYAEGCEPGEITDFMSATVTAKARIEPKQCSVVKLSTPVFSWAMPDSLQANTLMSVTVTRISDSQTWSATSPTPRLLFPHKLASGLYKWNVKYTNTAGVVVYGAQRRFSIASGTLYAVPSAETILTRLNEKGHPRALPQNSTFETIKRISLGEIGGFLDYRNPMRAYLANANNFIAWTLSPVEEKTRNSFAAGKAGEDAYDAYKGKIIEKVRGDVRMLENFGYAYYFTNDLRYKKIAMDNWARLSEWNVAGVTGEDVQDQANREIFLSLAIALDLFGNDFSVEQRQKIVSSLTLRMEDVMEKFETLDKKPYDSHLLTAILYVTEALLHTHGLIPDSGKNFKKAWDLFVTMAGTWGGTQDGGFGNSTGYAWMSLTYTARILAAVKLITNENIFQMPAFNHIGTNMIAMTAPNSFVRGQFGDGVETNDYFRSYTYHDFRLLANVTRRDDYEWYWRTSDYNRNYTGTLTAYHYLLLGAYQNFPSGTLTPPDLGNSFLFEDAGIFAAHSSTVEKDRSSLFFRSSRLGSYNHSHADNNAFTFVSRGKDMLISGGYYPAYLDVHHRAINRATRYKNALTFDGGLGQAEPKLSPVKNEPGEPVFYSMEAKGKIVNFKDNGLWAVATGDATQAYQGMDTSNEAWAPLLTMAIRSVAYNRSEGLAFIYDWAKSDSIKSWELNFQSLARPEINQLNKVTKITNEGVSVCVTVVSPGHSFSVNEHEGFSDNYLAKPAQFQTIYKVTQPGTQLIAVTIIDENCHSDLSKVTGVTFNGTAATINVNGKSMRFNQKTIEIPE